MAGLDPKYENERAAARQTMRAVVGPLLGLDYDAMVADYPGGPDAYERRVRGEPTPEDQAAWDRWEAEQRALAAAARAKKAAQQRAYRARRKQRQRGPG
jgi:hypothetical protein